MGSSRVMMWHSLVWLMRSMMQAWVVDLPLPAVPVTSTMPCWTWDRAITPSGISRSFQLGMSKATTRITAAMEPRWR